LVKFSSSFVFVNCKRFQLSDTTYGFILKRLQLYQKNVDKIIYEVDREEKLFLLIQRGTKLSVRSSVASDTDTDCHSRCRYVFRLAFRHVSQFVCTAFICCRHELGATYCFPVAVIFIFSGMPIYTKLHFDIGRVYINISFYPFRIFNSVKYVIKSRLKTFCVSSVRATNCRT
jgi:hypothetical protein